MIAMTASAKTCYLRPEDKSLGTVYLPNCVPIFVGRSRETNIDDTKCSRQQLQLYANYDEYTVTVQRIGVRSSCLNNIKMRKEERRIAKHNDCLEVLHGKYPYYIEFNPPPPKTYKKRPYIADVANTQNVQANKAPKLESAFTDDTDESSSLNDTAVPAKISLSDTGNSLLETNRRDSGNSSGESWETFSNGQLLIYTPENIEHRSKIAAYDMDGTLIKTRSGRVLPKDCDDWQLLLPAVPGKLKQLHADQYKIVIFTNQASIGNGKLKISDFKRKIESIVKKIGVPIQVFIATSKNIYRKPGVGMWEVLETKKNGAVPIDKANSFYVGDAAGRGKNWAPGKKKDHSCVDRLLALNLGLRFQTPEEHFLGHKPAPYQLPAFNPKDLSMDAPVCHASVALLSSRQEVILMVGCPGSGKSHFVRNHLAAYECVNRDTLGSWQKCVSALERYLSENKSVVVDNTNPDPASRQKYIAVAKKHHIPVRCFVMTTSVEHAKHNNKFRELTDPSHQKIEDIIIHSYLKNYVPPSLDEGFTEIVKINFVPKFRTEEERRLYEMYLLES